MNTSIIFLIFLHLSKTNIVKLEFEMNRGSYLALERSIFDDRIFVFTTVSRKTAIPKELFCIKASIRYVEDNIAEFFFCGYKMCFDSEFSELFPCEDSGVHTKWNMIPIPGTESFLLQSHGYCVTLKNHKPGCEPCKAGEDFSQAILMSDSPNNVEPLVTDDYSLEERRAVFECYTERTGNPNKKESMEQFSDLV